MRLRAVALESIAAIQEDVVGVEAGEAALRGEADEVRLREHAEPADPQIERPPVVDGEVTGAVDVDVADPERPQMCEIRADRLDRTTGVRLDVDRDREALAVRRAQHGRQPQVLVRPPPPPGAHDLVDPRLPDVPHLRPENPRVGAGIGPSRGEEVRGDVQGRCVGALLPVAVGPVVGRVRVPGVEEDRAPDRRCEGGGGQRQDSRQKGHQLPDSSPHRGQPFHKTRLLSCP